MPEQYDYRIIVIGTQSQVNEKWSRDLETRLNELGAEGFHVVARIQEALVMERPKRETYAARAEGEARR
jgi:hypothetical protein